MHFANLLDHLVRISVALKIISVEMPFFLLWSKKEINSDNDSILGVFFSLPSPQLDPLEHQWMMESAKANLAALSNLLKQDIKLAGKKVKYAFSAFSN